MTRAKLSIISLLFTCLAIITLLCHIFIDRYEQTGPEMLTDKWQVRSPQKENVQISGRNLNLQSDDDKKSVNIFQHILLFNKGDLLHLSADMHCEKVQSGKEPWNKARLLLVQHDGIKDRWDFPHSVAALSESKDWAFYAEAFKIQPETKQVKVVVQLNRCVGKFWLKNIRFYRVVQTQAYTWVKKGILFSWGIFGIFLLKSFFTNDRGFLVFKILIVLSFILIIIGTTMPQKMKLQVSKQVNSQLQENFEELDHVLPKDLSKIGHFFFFAVFACIAGLILYKTPFLMMIPNLMMLAGGTELAQFFIDGRGPLFTDFLIDIAGAISGLLLILIGRSLLFLR